MLSWILCIAGSYLVGSIPFGFLIARSKGIDIREVGSKNVGATNVGRVMGRSFGRVCLLLDISKGAVPVIVAGIINGLSSQQLKDMEPSQMWLWLAVAFASVLGHMYSPFLGFKGGKGVATGFGSLLAMWPLLTLPALVAMVVWYAVLKLTRYVSVASMLAAASLPVGYFFRILPPSATDQPISQTIDSVIHASAPLIVTVAMAILIAYKHRDNIARLRQGTEPKHGSPVE